MRFTKFRFPIGRPGASRRPRDENQPAGESPAARPRLTSESRVTRALAFPSIHFYSFLLFVAVVPVTGGIKAARRVYAKGDRNGIKSTIK